MAEIKVCEWKSEEDMTGDTIWETSCGDAFYFLEGNPKENGVKFCPLCGRKVNIRGKRDEKVKPYKR